ncbi:MAG: hypothetical protein ACTHKG_06215, partial [Nocardioides sp.]
MGRLPDPPAERETPRDLLARLAAHTGEARAAELCAELLEADSPGDHEETLLFLGGAAGRAVLAGTGGWKPYWARVWGARGLLYVWDDRAAPAVLAGLADPAWRVAEMCLKVSARRDLPCGDEAVRLARHELPRVRADEVLQLRPPRARRGIGCRRHPRAERELLGRVG